MSDELVRELALGFAEFDLSWPVPPVAIYVADDPSGATVRASLQPETAQPVRSDERTVLVYRRAQRGALQALLLGAGIHALIEYGHGAVDVLLAHLQRWRAVDQALARSAVQDHLIGTSKAWRGMLRTVAECALFSAAPILLNGPTGTGKELLARMIHTLDTRERKGDLIVVDCTTLSRELAGSELFGHERGSFTGAVAERTGALAAADHGSLFLDEVGDLDLDVQAQLLRALQEQAYRRVGGTRWQRSSFRLICATHRDLRADVQAGRFRSDLYHRIAAMRCQTPALAQRCDDIPALVQHALGDLAGHQRVEVDPALMEHLCSRSYPGNVRELVQLVRACLCRYPGIGALTLACLPDDEIQSWDSTLAPADESCNAIDRLSDKADAAPERVTELHDAQFDEFVRRAMQAGMGLKDLGRHVEATAVRIALNESGSIASAASRLGVTPRALHLRRATERTEARGPQV